jgi:thiamine pyrophosphate-dependent acetolactate synthase large subunit-like protein
MKRIEALNVINNSTRKLPLVVTCAATSRELASVENRPNHFYVLDSMGLVGSITTGLALAANDTNFQKVIAVEGDGSLLMNPNVLPTGGYLAPEKLFMILLDNSVYGSTASLPTYANKVDLGKIAEASGWHVLRAETQEELSEKIAEGLSMPGPVFLHAHTEKGNAADIPKLLVDPVTITNRFQDWFAQNSGLTVDA